MPKGVYIRTKEHKRKLSIANKGQIAWNKGKSYSKEIRQKMSESFKGRIPWNKGKLLSEEHRRKLSESHKDKFGVNSSNWKGGLSNNIEYHKEYNKQWQKNNRDKCNANHNKYNAMKLNQTPADVNMVEIQRIYSICLLMNEISTNIRWEVDHIIPLSKGGLHHQDNLQILTAEANHKKSNKILNNPRF